MIQRMDRNRDGVLHPEEVPPPARTLVARLAQQLKLNPQEPIKVEKFIERWKAHRAGKGTPSRAAGSKSPSGGDESPVPGFGVEQDLPAVPGFGEGADEQALPLEDRYDDSVIRYTQGVFSRYDKNKNDLLDQEEWKAIPWRSDPKKSDLNGDGRLSRAEYCERIARRWGKGWKSAAKSNRTTPASTGSFGSGKSDSSSPATSDSREKIRRYAKSLLRQYDRNRNGVLEKDEWRHMRGDPKAADKNGDDVVTLDELTDKLANYSRGSSSGKGTGTAGSPSHRSSSSSPSSYRTTGDAPSGKQETYRSKTAAERLPDGLPDWFLRNDANGDGQIAMSEFSATWSDTKAAEFAHYDQNGDGVITPKECLAAEKD